MNHLQHFLDDMRTDLWLWRQLANLLEDEPLDDWEQSFVEKIQKRDWVWDDERRTIARELLKRYS